MREPVKYPFIRPAVHLAGGPDRLAGVGVELVIAAGKRGGSAAQTMTSTVRVKTPARGPTTVPLDDIR